VCQRLDCLLDEFWHARRLTDAAVEAVVRKTLERKVKDVTASNSLEVHENSPPLG
jgi:hypothetical protein